MTPIYILTNDKHLWLLRGFSYCFNKFYPKQKVTIFGFGHPDFVLPNNFEFVSLDENNWPAQRWSSALIKMCNIVDDDYFIFMLEDYWLTSKVDNAAVFSMDNYIYLGNNDILRIDLSGNRSAYIQSQHHDNNNGYDIVQTPMHTPYQMSFQAAVWDRKLLLSVLKENETPWEAEIHGSGRVKQTDLKVLGAKDTILNYKPIYRTKGHKLQLQHMPKKLLNELKTNGCLT